MTSSAKMYNVKTPDKMARELARLEEAQRRTQQNLADAQLRMNRQFDRMRERLLKKYGATNDSQQRIIEAALSLLKEEGLDNLSLRKLAHNVNMQAPALYWHFKNKSALVDYMAEEILQRQFKSVAPRKADEPWQEWLVAHMQKLRKAMLAFPDGGRVVAGARLYPAVTLAKINEIALESLITANVAPAIARQTVVTAINYTFGNVIEEQASPSPEELASIDLDDFFESFPHLRQVVADVKQHGFDPDEDFKAGLRLIIHGAETI